MKRLLAFVGANEGENWAMYRPYTVIVLTFIDYNVKTMANSDHNFGCRKLQFRTVQISKLGCLWRNRVWGEEMGG
jgi:hypothetical protein